MFTLTEKELEMMTILWDAGEPLPQKFEFLPKRKVRKT